jgi:hypothetical protein
MDPYTAGVAIRKIYFEPFAFPAWVIDKNEWSTFKFADTQVFYHKEDSLDTIKKLLKEREPCNIALNRNYNMLMLKSLFGWDTGAYNADSPNFAVYCNATVKLGGHTKLINVLNLIGFALDSPYQPDYMRYGNNKRALIDAYSGMWCLAFAAAAKLKADGKIDKIKIYCVGGGAFAGPYGRFQFITDIFEPAFLPLVPLFEQAGVTIEGYDFDRKMFNGGMIPEVLTLPTEDTVRTLYVNAWDPWSLIGNGNEYDRSLDGQWGRISNMSVLGWLPTNPHMRFIPV